MKKLQEQVNNISLESSDWSDIHEDFVQEWFGKTYQQLWEENGLIRQDAQKWINAGFKPRDYSVVKRWKDQKFTPEESYKWIKINFRPSECEFVIHLKENGYTPDNTDPKEVREKFADWFKEREEDAQTFLDREYPLSERWKITELDISKKNLTGSLKLTGFNNLIVYDCSINQLTSLEFASFPNPTKLKWLSIGDNILSTDGDLNVFSTFINLEGLNIGSPYYPQVNWAGHMMPFKTLTKLKFLDIKRTNLVGSLEYLSDSLEEFYCGGTVLAEELKDYGSPEDGNYIDSGKNYTNLLEEWRHRNDQKRELSRLEAQIQVPLKK